jgi:hypothetical protein
MQDVRVVIRNAFSSVPKPPDGHSIAPHRCPECDELALHFLPYDQASLPKEVVQEHYDSLPLLSPEALRHYLPAYLIFALDHPGSDVTEFTIYQLTPLSSDDADTTEYHHARLNGFSLEQRLAIHAFFAEVTKQKFRLPMEEELARAAERWPGSL